jgi:hypothetical protein
VIRFQKKDANATQSFASDIFANVTGVSEPWKAKSPAGYWYFYE